MMDAVSSLCTAVATHHTTNPTNMATPSSDSSSNDLIASVDSVLSNDNCSSKSKTSSSKDIRVNSNNVKCQLYQTKSEIHSASLYNSVKYRAMSNDQLSMVLFNELNLNLLQSYNIHMFTQ